MRCSTSHLIRMSRKERGQLFYFLLFLKKGEGSNVRSSLWVPNMHSVFMLEFHLAVRNEFRGHGMQFLRRLCLSSCFLCLLHLKYCICIYAFILGDVKEL